MAINRKNIDKLAPKKAAKKGSDKKKPQKPSWLKTKKYVYKLYKAKYQASGGWKSTWLLDDTRKVMDVLIERNLTTTIRNTRSVYREFYRFKPGKRHTHSRKELSVSSLIPPRPNIRPFLENLVTKDFFQPSHFFEIEDLLKFVAVYPVPEIHFVSPMILGKDYSFTSATVPSYGDSFQSWVIYLSQEKNRISKEDPGAYDTAWFYKFKGKNIEEGLYYSFDNKRWEIEIISCDVDGNPYHFGWDTETGEMGANQDYDFTPRPEREETETPVAPVQPEQPIITTPPQVTSETVQLEKERLASQERLEKQKLESQERIQNAQIQSQEKIKTKQLIIDSIEKQFAAGRISFSEYFDSLQKVMKM